jgi:hypothetical protein
MAGFDSTSTALTLPIVHCYVQQRISRRELARAYHVDAILDSVSDHMVLTLRAELASDSIQDVTIRYPSDWWQALRARWFPASWLRRYPVCETVHHYEAKRVFPDFVYPKNLGRSICVVTHDTWTDKWWRDVA